MQKNLEEYKVLKIIHFGKQKFAIFYCFKNQAAIT